nr:hypothetical protein Q903MT_gene1726 [Picea sitchensis]
MSTLVRQIVRQIQFDSIGSPKSQYSSSNRMRAKLSLRDHDNLSISPLVPLATILSLSGRV